MMASAREKVLAMVLEREVSRIRTIRAVDSHVISACTVM